MTEPMSDANLAELRAGWLEHEASDVGIVAEFGYETIGELLACIEALTAERDAAVAKLDAMVKSIPPLVRDAQVEGERRATAAIVAYLRAIQANGMAKVVRCSDVSGGGPEYDLGRATGYGYAADAIERGEHLPAKPLDT